MVTLYLILLSILCVFTSAQLLHEAHHEAHHEHLREYHLFVLKQALTGALFDEEGACLGSSAGGCSARVPYNQALRQIGDDWPAVGHTMVGLDRIDNVKLALIDTISKGVPGDFVELGVWRGGVCIFARALLNAYHQPDRTVHIFDAFEQLPGYARVQSYLAVSEDQVKHNFEKYNLKEGFKFYKGLFRDTVPSFAKNFTGQIAVLRVDGNFYDSYQDAVYYLYDKVPVGGYVIFDDVMSHKAVMRFWTEFKSEQNIPEELIQIDKHSAYFKKQKAIVTDFKYFRAPQDVNK